MRCESKGFSDDHAAMIDAILSVIEMAEEDGYIMITLGAIGGLVGRNPGSGYINVTLWMLVDSGYIFAFEVGLGGHPQTAFNTTGLVAVSESEVLS